MCLIHPALLAEIVGGSYSEDLLAEVVGESCWRKLLVAAEVFLFFSRNSRSRLFNFLALYPRH